MIIKIALGFVLGVFLLIALPVVLWLTYTFVSTALGFG